MNTPQQIKQPTPFTCVQTCLAMAADLPVDYVMEDWGYDPLSQKELQEAAESYGLKLTECGRDMDEDGWYFATVPSLNLAGAFHQVLIKKSGQDLVVLDPAYDNEYADDGSDLYGWCDLLLIEWEGGEDACS